MSEYTVDVSRVLIVPGYTDTENKCLNIPLMYQEY